MFDAKRLLDQFIGSQGAGDRGFGRPDQPGRFGDQAPGDFLQQAGQALSGFGGGALTGGLAGLLLGSKGGRKIVGSALTYGGMAVAGALAYRAYQNWQAGKSATPASNEATPLLPPPADTPFNPASEAEQQSLGRNLLRAMIAAAKSDGHIDAKEQTAIFAEMDKLNLDSEDKAFVMDELRRPLDVDAVARGARTPEETAVSIFAEVLVSTRGATGRSLATLRGPIHRVPAGRAARPADCPPAIDGVAAAL